MMIKENKGRKGETSFVFITSYLFIDKWSNICSQCRCESIRIVQKIVRCGLGGKWRLAGFEVPGYFGNKFLTDVECVTFCSYLGK